MIKLVFNAIKFLVVYTILMSIAVFSILVSIIITEFITSGQSEIYLQLFTEQENDYVILGRIMQIVFDNISFSDLFEAVIEKDSGIIGGILDFGRSFKNGKLVLAWKEYVPNFFRDVSIATMTSLFLFVYSRLNRYMKGWIEQFIYVFATIFWYFASFCVSNCIMTVLESKDLGISKNTLYLIVLIVSFAIHFIALTKSYISSRNQKSSLFDMLRVFMILALDVIFLVISSLLLWMLKDVINYLTIIYDPTSYLVVALLLLLIQIIKNETTKFLSGIIPKK